MRSLFVTRWAPDRMDGGAALRNMQNLRALAALGPVDVISIGGPEPARAVPGVADWQHFVLPARRPPLPGAWLSARHHPLIRRHHHAGALAHIQALPRGRHDLAVVEEIALAGYIAPLRAAGIPVVFDAHNVEARLRADIAAGGLRPRIMAHRLAAAEAGAMRAADLIWCCSDVDARLITRLYHPRAQVAVVPNAVDIDAYAEALASQRRRGSEPPRLLYIGSYAYPPNEAAALRLIHDILPALRLRGLDLPLALVGRDPTAAMHQAAAGDRGVEITGAVASVLPWLAAPAIMVSPIMQGSGTRLKILEAFAAGCPVISTAKGAEGIATNPGENIILAESNADFIAAIARLSADPAARRALGEAAYHTACAHYSWGAAAGRVHSALAGLGPQRKAG